jgi:hypothetical protein
MPPDYSHRDAMCAYLELTARPEQALAVRDAELATVRDRGRFAYECACRLKRCVLRRRLGVLTGEDLDEARAAARRLRDPSRPLEQLARLASGGAP